MCPLNHVMIKELTGGLLSALKHYYKKVGKAFIGLSPSSVIYAFKKQKFVLTFGFGVKLNMLANFENSKQSADQTLNYYKSLRKRFWMDLFALGLLIIRGIFGYCLDDLARLIGFYLPDLFQPDALNFNTDQSISTIPEKCREFCCLFHYMEHVVLQDEQKIKADIGNYVRIYELASPESIYVACTQFRQISKPLKDFLCHLTHLDFKNPSHFHDDILSHPYANDCLSLIKVQDPPTGHCNLYEAVKMLRRAELKQSIGSDGCWFQGVSKQVDKLYRHEILYMDQEEFEKKVKILARILGMDRHKLRAVLEPHLHKKPARRQLY